MIKNIVFYYPSRRIGGAQLLFYRCAEWLSSLKRYNVSYIDYVDGFVRGQLDKTNIAFIDQADIIIPEYAIIVLPLSRIMTYNRIFGGRINDTTRFLFWSIHPHNITDAFTIKNRFLLPPCIRNSAGRTIDTLSEMGVIRYMDYQNYDSVYSAFHLKEKSGIAYLPIPFGDEEQFVASPVHRQNNCDVISFLWLSRLMGEKTQMVTDLFVELEHLDLGKDIVLHIVGDGEDEELIKQESLKYGFKTIMHGRMYGLDLDTLIDSVDIGVAVGTSALEIAKRCKPVIVGAPSLYYEDGGHVKEKRNKEYIVLSQQTDYSVGGPQFYTPGQRTFNDLCHDILHDYEKYSKDCCDYVLYNHSMSKVGEALLSGFDKLSLLAQKDMIHQLEKLRLKMVIPMKIIGMLKRVMSF